VRRDQCSCRATNQEEPNRVRFQIRDLHRRDSRIGFDAAYKMPGDERNGFRQFQMDNVG